MRRTLTVSIVSLLLVGCGGDGDLFVGCAGFLTAVGFCAPWFDG